MPSLTSVCAQRLRSEATLVARSSGERAFLAASLPPALARKEPDTVAEIVEALAALGVSDTHPLIEAGRGFLLTAQGPDGGWGDKADSYGRFHTIWAAIDGLRDHAWTRRRDIVRKTSR